MLSNRCCPTLCTLLQLEMLADAVRSSQGDQSLRSSPFMIFECHMQDTASLMAALHLEAGTNPLEAHCMKSQPLLSWRPASTTHYNNKIVTGANFPIWKGLRAKKSR